MARKASLRPQLLNAGFHESNLVDSTRVLGVDFTARLRAKDRKTQDSRIAMAKHRIARISLLPVSVQRKASFIASLAIPKAVWGAWIAIHPLAQLLTPVKHAAGGLHRCASNQLFYVLSGHGLEAKFCAGMQAFSYLAAVVRSDPRPWPPRARQGTWLSTVKGFLRDLNWQIASAWKWTHPDLPFSIDLSRQVSEVTLLQEQHAVRESWRRVQFRSFLASGRRDAAAVGNVAYSEERMTAARHIFRSQNAHGRGVMVGAIVSDARFDRIRGLEIQNCVWCNADVCPTWEHLAWFCPGFSSTRCQVPSESLQYVLGWPVGRDRGYDSDVLTHLSDVRSKLLERRYRSPGVA